MHKHIFWLSFLASIGMMVTIKPVNAQDTNLSDVTGTQTTNSSTVTIDATNGNGSVPNTPNISDNGVVSVNGTNIQIDVGSSRGSSAGTGSSAGIGSGSGSGSGLGSGTGTGSSSGSGTGLGTPTIRESGSTDGSSGSQTAGNTPEGSDGGNEGRVVREKGECLAENCLEASNEPQKITLNEVAELLENNLDDSIDNLIAVENPEDGMADNSGVALTDRPEEGEPRRIVRNARRNTSDEDARRIVRNSSNCVNGCANPDRRTVEARQINDRQVAAAREIVERQLEESQKFIEQVNLIDPEKNIW